MIALVSAYRQGLFKQHHWVNNIISGVIVGIIALPLAMAFAIASGAKPEQGIYTAIIAGTTVSLLGGTRLQIAGPTGAFVVILSAISAKYGIEGLQLATLLAGVILILLGATRCGSLIKFIPSPVIIGFTTGIAVIIWLGQWPYFLGIPVPEATHLHTQLLQMLSTLSEIHYPTTLMAVISLLILISLNRVAYLRKIPAPLIVLVCMTLVQYYGQFTGIATIGSKFGGIPQGLPTLVIPTFTFTKMIELIGPAFAIAMLGAIESLLSAVVADSMTGTRHHSNQELIGQGIANILAPLFGGFAATGAMARTAANVRNGATSPLSGIVHALTLVLIICVFAPLAVHIPLSALAAILFMVAWNMSEFSRFRKLIDTAPRADVALLLITFSLTVLADLIVAVNIGVILASLYFLRRMARSVAVTQTTAEDIQPLLAHYGFEQLPAQVAIYAVDGPFFFGASEKFEQALQLEGAPLSQLIIHLRWVPFVDITALQSLELIIRDLQQKGVQVSLSGGSQRIQREMAKAGIHALVGQTYCYQTLSEALAYVLHKEKL